MSDAPLIRTSRLLSSLNWLEHAFLPAGMAPPAESAFGHQRHTATVITAEEAFPPKVREADGVLTNGSRPAAIYTADCLPVLIADTRQYQVAAVHAGLKGALAGVLMQAVTRLISGGATPDSLFVAIGPAIASCCYELGNEVMDNIRANPLVTAPRYFSQQPRNERAIRPQARATQHGIWFDLPALGRQMLLDMQIPAAQIEVLPVCTYCSAEPRSSYRRNTHTNEGYDLRYAWIRRR
ncbi:polyphenol oxidase family protein [Mixta intestinalis]|jgi:YfiH family protein|uniref:Laccase domain protein YfiH n=1 Tax=Mixta intestinalis TaxID=1615494 RepID=A0A6P1Q316_9GAMM|nr:laccase domain-containing protein [Mixta intestinalis]QHM72499.1 Laccase domain protein YfiH [Mixta intestinalis]